MAQSANKRVKKIRPSTNVTDIAYSNDTIDLSNDSISPSVSIKINDTTDLIEIKSKSNTCVNLCMPNRHQSLLLLRLLWLNYCWDHQ